MGVVAVCLKDISARLLSELLSAVLLANIQFGQETMWRKRYAALSGRRAHRDVDANKIAKAFGFI